MRSSSEILFERFLPITFRLFCICKSPCPGRLRQCQKFHGRHSRSSQALGAYHLQSPIVLIRTSGTYHTPLRWLWCSHETREHHMSVKNQGDLEHRRSTVRSAYVQFSPPQNLALFDLDHPTILSLLIAASFRIIDPCLISLNPLGSGSCSFSFCFNHARLPPGGFVYAFR